MLNDGVKISCRVQALILLALLILPLFGSLLAHRCPVAHDHILLRGATLHDLAAHLRSEAQCRSDAQPQRGTILILTSQDHADRLPLVTLMTTAIFPATLPPVQMPVAYTRVDTSPTLNEHLTSLAPLTPPPERA